MISIRELVVGDEAIATAFLASRPDTTMFLRSNLARMGLSPYAGETYQGVYVGAFDGDDDDDDDLKHRRSRSLVGIVAHYWNGNMILAGGEHALALAHAVLGISKRPLKGFLGPYEEVEKVRRQVIAETKLAYQSREILFALDLAQLVIPHALSDGVVSARTPNDIELPMLLEWRMAYSAETMRMPDTPEKREQQRKFLQMLHTDGNDMLVFTKEEEEEEEQQQERRSGCEREEPVAYSAFNATLPDIVQVGSVWTPPALRGRGYARCAVAASLVKARERGVTRAILFTDEANIAAQRCYVSLGFREIGDYSLVFFA
jgi:RimJ/RimL family protein N-acetyltransferase